MSYENDKITEDGIEYPVTYRKVKNCYYAKAIIQGHVIEGSGDSHMTAYWSLGQKIYQTFHFKL